MRLVDPAAAGAGSTIHSILVAGEAGAVGVDEQRAGW